MEKRRCKRNRLNNEKSAHHSDAQMEWTSAQPVNFNQQLKTAYRATTGAYVGLLNYQMEVLSCVSLMLEHTGIQTIQT
jgi:hypothetical protein